MFSELSSDLKDPSRRFCPKKAKASNLRESAVWFSCYIPLFPPFSGVTHNISLLRDILSERNFQEGNINTNYLAHIYPDGFQGKPLSHTNLETLSALVSMIYAKLQLRHWDNVNVDESLLEVKPDQWRCHVTHAGSPIQCAVKRTEGRFFNVSEKGRKGGQKSVSEGV